MIDPSRDEQTGNRGQSISRRDLLRSGLALTSGLILGAHVTGRGSNLLAASGAQAAQGCVASPQLTEGPYFLDARLERSDIRSDPETGEVRQGLPLRLALSASLLQGGECQPLSGASFDIWHCDALGSYSGFADNTMGGHGVDQKFLRGYQVTDAEGRVNFLTVYPGWYRGRAVHIHFKIRSGPRSEIGYELTSQFFFDDALSDEIFSTMQPYVQKGLSTTRNEADGIYRGSNGLLTLQPRAEGEGYAAAFSVVLDPSAPAGPGGPRRRP